MKRGLNVVALLMSALAHAADTGTGSSNQEGTTSTGLVAAAVAGLADEACLQWHFSGVCFWLRCSIYECHVETSIRYGHYLPDLAVSTYHDPDQHPWTDYGKSVAKASTSLLKAIVGSDTDAAGTRTRGQTKDLERTDKNIHFRDGDAIGHPYQEIGRDGISDYLCPQVAVEAFQPYMLTGGDGKVWRAYWPAESLYLATWIPGLREIGTFPLNTWGNVFPRTGWAPQQHDVKTSAVVSERIGDIVTRTGEPHVYTEVGNNSTKESNDYLIWQPPSLIENMPSTGTWQMVAPKQTSCTAFGENDSVLPLSYGDQKTSAASGYTWALWRPYNCCHKEGQIFLFYIGAN